MKYDIYSDYIASDDLSVVEFTSIGINGRIIKRVAFMPTEANGVYNLAFGDVDEYDDIDDYKITNNGDRNKVLATVVNIVDEYTRRHPARWIYFQGSTEERTRLYRMAIGLNLEELSPKFEIYGIHENGDADPFTKNMLVTAFLIKRKIS